MRERSVSKGRSVSQEDKASTPEKKTKRVNQHIPSYKSHLPNQRKLLERRRQLRQNALIHSKGLLGDITCRHSDVRSALINCKCRMFGFSRVFFNIRYYWYFDLCDFLSGAVTHARDRQSSRAGDSGELQATRELHDHTTSKHCASCMKVDCSRFRKLSD